MKNEHVIGAIVIAFVLGLLIGRAGVSPSTDTSKVYEYIFTGAPAGVAGAPTGATPSGPVDAARTLGLSGSPSKGVATAKVTIIESSDFQWPYCGKVGPTLKKVLETYPNDVRVVFMHNPLGFHKRAMPAAKASMAAHAQGKFWEYHDLLFAKKRFDDAALEGYATELGLDMARFTADMNDPKVEAKILHDQASMVGHGARGTPAFFVNGKYMSGAKPFGAFQKEIDEAIKAADAAMAGGTSLKDVHRVMAGKNIGATFVASVIDGKPAPTGPPPKKASAKKKPPTPKGPVKIDVHPDDAMKGNPKAPITIVEFSEYQWPYCAKVGPTYKKILAEYKDDVRIVFKHLPLGFHQYAFEAAEASLAAGAQGKFWEYHDLLFQNQRKLTRPDLEAYAGQLGLDVAKFKKALDTDQFKAQVERDKAAAQKIGVRGTPNAFINGYNIRGAQPFSAFKAIIDRELAKARGEAPPAALAAAAPNLGLFDKESFPTPTAGTISVGNSSAPTEVVMYLDLQDEFSGTVLKTLREMQQNNRRSVRLVVKHFPMGFHKQALRAAQAVESVAKRAPTKLWDYLTALNANHRSLSDARLVEIANGLGADGAGVKTDLAENTYLKKVKDDLSLGRSRGAKATPTLFVNGRRYTGMKGYDSDSLKALLKANTVRGKTR